MRYDSERVLGPLRDAETFVIGQLGQTLDGRVATESGESLYINGREALAHLHRLRAVCDAVIVGVGTIAADDPRLTVRLCEGHTPVRVVIDPADRMPADSQCLYDGNGSVIVIREGHGTVRHPAGSPTYADGSLPYPDRVADTEEIILPRDDSRLISWHAIVAALAERGLKRLLIEGGPSTLSHALDADAVDFLHVMVAPKLLGSGRTGLNLLPVERLADARSPVCETHLFEDGDVLFCCDMRQERVSAET